MSEFDVTPEALEVFAVVHESAPISVEELERRVGRSCEHELTELEIEAYIATAGGEVVLTVWGGACAEDLLRLGRLRRRAASIPAKGREAGGS